MCVHDKHDIVTSSGNEIQMFVLFFFLLKVRFCSCCMTTVEPSSLHSLALMKGMGRWVGVLNQMTHLHTHCCCCCRRQMMKMKSRATLRSASQLSCAGCRVSTGSSVSEAKGKSWWSGLKLELCQISGHIFTAPFFLVHIWIGLIQLADTVLPICSCLHARTVARKL